MMDLQNRLGQFIGETQPPTAADIAADVARGRQAKRRRRTAQTAAGSAFGIAALAAAVAVATSGIGTGSPSHPVAERPPAGVSTSPAIVLAAYTGEQPKGFTIDTVPQGWFIQADKVYNLVLAPNKVKNPGPNVDPSKAPGYDPNDYTGKIAIFIVRKGEGGPRGGTPIKVGGQDGLLVKVVPSGSGVWVEQPSGNYLEVQFWGGLQLTKDQMIEIAAGVHVHKAAETFG